MCTSRLIVITTVLVLISSVSFSQHLVNGFFKGKNQGSVCLSYSWEQYGSFYFADEKRNTVPGPYQNTEGGGKITTQTVSAFINYGLSENIELSLNIPYISQTGDGTSPPPQKESDFQDASLFIKWRPVNIALENGNNLSFIGALGGIAPLSDYTANAPLSIGNHATRLDIQGVTHYKHNSGFFGELQAGYSLRGHEVTDVPNATLLGARLGMALNNFYFDFWSKTQISDTSAPDITPGEVPFYETRVNYTQIGINTYYPFTSNFGISANYGQYVGGRNVGLASRVSGTLIYNF